MIYMCTIILSCPVQVLITVTKLLVVFMLLLANSQVFVVSNPIVLLVTLKHYLYFRITILVCMC